MAVFRFVNCMLIVSAVSLRLAAAQLDSLGADDSFPLPASLRANVAFWVKIYTEVSVGEGLIHDRLYPQIVYEKLACAGPGGLERVERRKEQLGRILANINQGPSQSWGSEEKALVALFGRHGLDAALSGAAERLRFQQGLKERFVLGLQRSTQYLDTIRAIFTAHGLPARLAYLPHVESSFDVQAYSKAGAAGMWQFMPGTGRRFLRIDYLVDERRDPILSTVAAARYLKLGYGRLGSWPLAVTAYNFGVQGMYNATRTTGSMDLGVIVEKFESSRFRFASRNFYCCFLAAAVVAEQPRRYFPDFQGGQPPFRARSIEIAYPIWPAELCRQLRIPAQELRRLNPALRQAVFQGRYQIPAGVAVNIPASIAADTVVKVMVAMIKAGKQSPPPQQRYHVVAAGESLYRIARHYGVTVAVLADANGLTRRSHIRKGQVLRVPTTPKGKAKSNRGKRAGKRGLSLFGAPDELPDSLSWAAEQSVGEPPDSPALGRLRLFDASLYDLQISSDAAPGLMTVRVNLDESLSGFARWLSVSERRIWQLNGFRPGAVIFLGDSVKLPLASEAERERFEARRLEAHMAIEEDFFDSYIITGLHRLKIPADASLEALCATHAVPLWLVKKCNRRCDLAGVKPDAEIWFPQISAINEHTPSPSSAE